MEIALRAERAGMSLARWLGPLAFTDWSAARVTSELTRAIVAWGTARGWRVRCEVPSLAGLPGSHPDRPGYLDVVCERLGAPPIAIEIDQTDKASSVRKLVAEAEAGVVPVWVRWGDPVGQVVPAPVALVVIETPYRLAGPTGRRLYSRAAVDIRLPAAPQPLRCRATTKEGQPCAIDPRPSGLCHVHDPAVQCGGRTRKGKICVVPTGGGRCKYHLDQVEDAPRTAPLWPPDLDMS
ncbi:hypothetical protein [Nonomuraea dietziae]|uniref:hypothetical protein n=1 Tax=Nonomuraea dietziae TaxID=65515 RepID=UPI0034188307